ncbi:hypothetical protein ACFQ1M_14900 [Sungkyunkwania multivorans]|uniref:Uncharacterized protein n=1 Tax=Sungkyunkwania multivorans TaxID=1173618 RepID=A0ABW3D242_9FLAO
MKKYMVISLVFLIASIDGHAQDTKIIHVYVALCDNVNQGIVPVSRSLGNGQNPKTNLYWGALYGVKTHFKRSGDWEYLGSLLNGNPKILERVLFKHRETGTYLLADAYDGSEIKQATIDFLKAASGKDQEKLILDKQGLYFGGGADLVAYVGHDGLMEFELDIELEPDDDAKRDAIVLACFSKDYFKPYIKNTGANPLVWSTGLMSPEAYTLKQAIDGWISGETDAQIRERAAAAYHQYQKCGMRGARRLLVTGY